MIARAEAKYVRISPTKARIVTTYIKGMYVAQALAILKTINKRAASLVEKVVRSALANATSKGFEEKKLYISRLVANSGPTLKRYRAGSFGRASMIRKRTSHIVVELDTYKKEVSSTKKG